MMNGKFHKSWGDFGSLRNKAALEYECFRALANGAKCCIGDQLHPSGKIDKSVYKRIGEVYGSVKQKEKWCSGSKKVSQIGVYTANRVFEAENHIDTGATDEGVYRVLSELHYLFDFIDYQCDIENYDLVILPDKVRLPPDVAAKIREYLKKGGKLLNTGSSGLAEGKNEFALKEFGIQYISDAEYSPRYVHITEENFPGVLPMDYVMYEKGITVKAGKKAEIQAYIVNPYFNRTYDRFCSHRQTPPAGVTDEPFIVRNGDVIHISNPLFKDYAINGNMIYKDILSQCIHKLISKPTVITNLPSTAELTLRRQGDKYILHLLHYIPQRKCRAMDIIEEVIPIYNIEVKVKLDIMPQEVFTAPVLRALDFSFDSGYVCFNVPEVNGHQMVIIE